MYYGLLLSGGLRQFDDIFETKFDLKFSFLDDKTRGDHFYDFSVQIRTWDIWLLNVCLQIFLSSSSAALTDFLESHDSHSKFWAEHVRNFTNHRIWPTNAGNGAEFSDWMQLNEFFLLHQCFTSDSIEASLWNYGPTHTGLSHHWTRYVVRGSNDQQRTIKVGNAVLPLVPLPAIVCRVCQHRLFPSQIDNKPEQWEGSV